MRKTAKNIGAKNIESVDIVIPVYNEEKVLEQSINKLRKYIMENNDLSNRKCRIIIADNASTDKTRERAEKLAVKYKDAADKDIMNKDSMNKDSADKDAVSVAYEYIPRKGRGIALRTTWLKSDADAMCYMDVDLSTELIALPKLVNALENGYDIVYASRLSKESKTERCFKRDLLSRGYNLLVKMILWTKFSDAQCGFKGITRENAQKFIPMIKDNEWFFDTELLVLGEKSGCRLYEIPVRWDEDPDSKVRIFKTVYDYIRDLLRMRLELWFEHDFGRQEQSK